MDFENKRRIPGLFTVIWYFSEKKKLNDSQMIEKKKHVFFDVQTIY